MAEFERGKPISAGDLNATVDEAQTGANITGDGIDVAKGPGGQAIALPRIAVPQPNMIRAQFIGTGNVPLYGVVEVYEGWLSYYEKAVGKCRIPSQSGFARVGAALKGVGSNQITNFQIQGIGYVIFDYASVPALYQTRTRYRLGAKKASHIAQYDQLGPFLVIKDLGAIAGAYHAAVVEFTGERGDQKIADTDDRVDGPYHTYAWAPGYDIVETSPGNVTIILV